MPLLATSRHLLEGFFDADFGSVRVHEGPAAELLGARAFASGEALHFARGAYRPHTLEGIELLAHELAHVLQQREGLTGRPRSRVPLFLVDRLLEEEADRLGRQARTWLEQGRRPDDFLPVGARSGPRRASRPAPPGEPTRALQPKLIFTNGYDEFQGARFLDPEVNKKLRSKVYDDILKQAKALPQNIIVRFPENAEPEPPGGAVYTKVSAGSGRIIVRPLTPEQIKEGGSELNGLLAAMIHETQHAIDHLGGHVKFNGQDEATLHAEWRAWAIEAAFIYEAMRAGQVVPYTKRDLPDSYRSKADFIRSDTGVALNRTLAYLDFCNVIKKPNLIQARSFVMNHQGWLHDAVVLFYDHVEGGIAGATWPGDAMGGASVVDENAMEEVD
ncbi:DUF4157 domain-containing protein [Myxococcus stipitatus]|uniref:eCIS core domain-containing protein n=1 Tax=Myxococcus stipitatus TaxID=83455 RepID=UPI001F25F6A7|nr:DUF4157 domain-containing protein [Myxococcus stipitatus]MCE9673720.1 DUF4157 domain-containing protein [Myxococcus stipitatus]